MMEVQELDLKSSLDIIHQISAIKANAVFTKLLAPNLNNINNNIQGSEDTLRHERPQVAW